MTDAAIEKEIQDKGKTAPRITPDDVQNNISSVHYFETSGLTFGNAIEALKIGSKVCRAGWNGKGMWLKYVREDKYGVQGLQDPYSYKPDLLPWIGMKTADDKFVPWLASQTDVLADDWQIVL